jgi:Lysine-specific metallo-endopeptidase
MLLNIISFLVFAGTARSVILQGCNANQSAILEVTIANALSMATTAYIAIGTGAYEYDFIHWFSSNSTDVKDKVRSVYVDIINNIQNKSLILACNDSDPMWIDDVDNSIQLCSDPRNGTMWVDTDVKGKILFCPNNGWWSYRQLSPTCRSGINIDMAGTVIQVVSEWSGTNHYVNGKKEMLNITSEIAVKNALTYALWAESVRLGGCWKEVFFNGTSNGTSTVTGPTPAKLLRSRPIKPLPSQW